MAIEEEEILVPKLAVVSSSGGRGEMSGMSFSQLQRLQAATTFSHLLVPPREIGIT